MIEFRGLSPESRDTLKCASANQTTARDADWRYASLIAPNGLLKPFGDSQLCQAITFTVGGSPDPEFLADDDGVKIVGGVTLPNHSFAATKVVLHIGTHLAGVQPAGWIPSGDCAS